MIVCVCRRVSDREIARHVRAGMTFDEVQLELGVATQCGQCESCARDVVAQCTGMVCPESLADEAATVDALAIATDVMIPVGVATLGIAIVLAFTLQESSSGTRVSAACGPTGCALELGWRL